MDGKTVLITGGNTGIGKETAIALARMGARVVFTSRNVARGERAAAQIRERSGSDVDWLRLDLASFGSIRQCAREFLERYDRLDVLVNNAGLMLGERRETEEGFEATFGINHLGHFLLTDLLLERIRASAPARIVNVASGSHRTSGGLDFEDLQSTKSYQAYRAYADSKLANIYFTRELARRLEAARVTANAVHPGVVASDFAGDGDVRGPTAWFFKLAKPLLRTPEKGARTSIYVASAPELEGVTGRYFKDEQRMRPAPVALDEVAARRLWEVSAELIQQASGNS